MVNYFTDVIGQSRAVTHLNKLCNTLAERTVPIQPIALLGHAGLGKNFIAERIAPALELATRRSWNFVELSCSIKPDDFVNVWLDEIEGRDAVIFVDEIHGFKNAHLVNLAKRLIETDGCVKRVRDGIEDFTANPFSHFWVAATDKDMKDSALIGPEGRFKPLQLVNYTESEVAVLLVTMAKSYGLSFTSDALNFLVTRVKKNARATKQLCDDVMLTFRGEVTLSNARSLVVETQRFPNGLSLNDVKTLIFLGTDSKGKQVSEVAAHCDGENTSICSYRLKELAGEGFVGTASGKKILTRPGKRYLNELQKLQENL